MAKRLTYYCMQMLSIVQRCAKARTLVELHVTFDTGFVLHTGPWRMSVAQRELDSMLEHGWDECDPELLR